MVFKKQIVFIIAILLLVSNNGIAFKVHYCGENIASIGLETTFNDAFKEDGCCDDVKEYSTCCSDKTIKPQKSIDQLLFKSISFETPNFIIPIPFEIISANVIANYNNIPIIGFECSTNAPPIFKKNCQFIFYDAD